MEYVEGVRIDDYCARMRLTARERLKLFLLVCRAVAYAHDQHVVHRDLKPSNILVTNAGAPKLLDFGIAKVLVADGDTDEVEGEGSPPASDAAALRHDLTVTEIRAFTPDYAAPEQIRGDRRITPAADVFSLGVLLASLFDAPATSRSRPTPEAPTPLPSDAGAAAPAERGGEKNPFLRRELDNIIAMARRSEPERRYQSARELGQDIERHLDGLPVVAQPDTLRYRAAKFMERHKTFLAASSITTCVLVIAFIAARFYVARSAPPATAVARDAAGPASGSAARLADPLLNVRAIAVLPLKSFGTTPASSGGATRGQGDDQDLSDQALRVGMAESIVTKLSQVRQLAVRPMSATVRYLDEDYDAVAVGRELEVDSVLEGTLQRAGDQLRTNLQLVDVASGSVVWAESVTSDLSNVLRGQDSLANRVSQLLAINKAGAELIAAGNVQVSANREARDAFLRGSLALATANRQVANLFTARDGFEQAIRIDPEFALAHATLANAYTLAGSLQLLPPRDAYPRAERAARRALEIDPRLAPAYVALAEVEADYN
jgi:TolB-like protein